MNTQRVQNSLVFLFVIASLALWTYAGVRSFGEMSLVVMYGAYYAMLALFLTWTYSMTEVLEAEGFSAMAFLRRYSTGLLFCFLAVLMICISVKPSFKTVPDEVELLATSHSMVFRKASVIDLKGANFYGDYYPGMPEIDHRPFFFPFLTNLLHTLRGFSPANGFLVNALIAFLFLSAVYICARQYFDGPLSAAAVILVMSIPEFSIRTASGGMDLASCFFLGLSFVLMFLFMRNSSSEKFSILWMTLLVLVNLRFENLVFFFMFLGYLMVFGYVKRSFLQNNRVLIAMTPLWLSLRIFERLISPRFDVNPEMWFSFAHFRQNLLDFLKGQVNFHFNIPFNPLLNLFSYILLGFLFTGIVIQKRIFQKPEQRRFALILTVSLLVQLCLILTFGGGYYWVAASTRYFIPFSVALAAIPFFWLMTLTPERVAKLSTPFLLGAIALFCLYHPVAVEGRFVNEVPAGRETRFVQDDIKRRYPERKIVVIGDTPEEFTALGYGAADFATANANLSRFFSGLSQHLYQDIIVVQRIAYATHEADPKDVLDPRVPLETLSEYETADDSFMRISRVKVN